MKVRFNNNRITDKILTDIRKIQSKLLENTPLRDIMYSFECSVGTLMLNYIMKLCIHIILQIEMIKTQTVSSGPSAAMDRKKQSGSFFGLQPGGSSIQDLVCPHP